MIRFHFTKFLLALFLVIVFHVGCKPYEPPAGGVGASTFAAPKTEKIVMIVMDLSGSFAELMAEEGAAFDFAMAVYNEYFASRIGSPDELIICQLSGTHRSLIWRGSPLALRQQFPSADDFKEFLMSKADPNGSLIHAGLAQALEYLVNDPALRNGTATSAVFCLSDLIDTQSMTDTAANVQAAERRLDAALAAYGQLKGVMGMYYVDQDMVSRWSQRLATAGIDYHVECIIDEQPELPVF